ncbi:MAG: uracil-DNA glycosylase [candidate division WOR-3 bacterium]
MELEKEFQRLQRKITQCRRCLRLVEWRERVARQKTRRFKTQEYWGRPVPAFGVWTAPLIIIGLAPAAHGGNRTGRMFTGDGSGEWLCDALFRFGFASQPFSSHRGDDLKLKDCLITAALRCAPPGNKPRPEELNRCREYLRREPGLAHRKRIVITLGRIAFDAFFKAWFEVEGVTIGRKPKFSHGAEFVLPGELKLLVSFHPSRQNTQTGRLTRKMFDDIFRRAREILDRDG